MIELTRDQWKKFAPGCPANYTDALFDNLDLLRQAGILDSEYRWCHFAATIYEETGNFSEIRENMSYRTGAVLRKTWPSRFGHKDDDALKPLLRNPKGLAEAVYGGRMGNRRGTSDAYDYRGGGWFQTTGREAVHGYCTKLGTEPNSGTLDDPLLTLRFAILEWTETKCNHWADENDPVKVAKAINTGSATSGVQPVGMADRRRAFARAWALWGESGEADHPAEPITTADMIKKAAAPAAGTAVAAGEIIKQAPSLPAPPAAINDALAHMSAWSDVMHQMQSFGAPVLFLVAAVGGVWWVVKGK